MGTNIRSYISGVGSELWDRTIVKEKVTIGIIKIRKDRIILKVLINFSMTFIRM